MNHQVTLRKFLAAGIPVAIPVSYEGYYPEEVGLSAPSAPPLTTIIGNAKLPDLTQSGVTARRHGDGASAVEWLNAAFQHPQFNQLSLTQKAELHFQRCLAFSIVGDYPRARWDGEQSIAFFEQGQPGVLTSQSVMGRLQLLDIYAREVRALGQESVSTGAGLVAYLDQMANDIPPGWKGAQLGIQCLAVEALVRTADPQTALLRGLAAVSRLNEGDLPVEDIPIIHGRLATLLNFLSQISMRSFKSWLPQMAGPLTAIIGQIREVEAPSEILTDSILTLWRNAGLAEQGQKIVDPSTPQHCCVVS
jgi:hypothetical protein